MGKKIFLVSLILLLATTAAWADFINGGFEDGNFNGWTLNGGRYDTTSPYYHYTGNPGKSAIVTPGYDPLTNYQLPTVAYGNDAARVNNYDNNYHFSTLSQTGVWNDPNIYFAWAAVLEEPGNGVPHPGNEAPNFTITLHDNTTNTDLYHVSFGVFNPPSGVTWKTGATGGSSDGNSHWRFNDWVIAHLDTTGVMGDSLTLTVLAADCALGGHGGYAYVDFFSKDPPPPPPPSVPVPASVLLLGSGLVGLGGLRFWRKLS